MLWRRSIRACHPTRPPKVVQEHLGHSTITTTMNIYNHVTPTMQKNAVDQFAGRLAGT